MPKNCLYLFRSTISVSTFVLFSFFYFQKCQNSTGQSSKPSGVLVSQILGHNNHANWEKSCPKKPRGDIDKGQIYFGFHEGGLYV